MIIVPETAPIPSTFHVSFWDILAGCSSCEYPQLHHQRGLTWFWMDLAKSTPSRIGSVSYDLSSKKHVTSMVQLAWGFSPGWHRQWGEGLAKNLIEDLEYFRTSFHMSEQNRPETTQDIHTNSMIHERKIWHIEHHQNENLKRHQWENQVKPTEWEKLFPNYVSDKGLVYRIH